VVSRPASIGWNDTFKTQIDQVEFVDKTSTTRTGLVSLT
jgi:hypothetical protein